MSKVKRIAAITVAAVMSAASVSVCAFASDVTLTGGPFEFTIENRVSAEGYEDEAKAVLNYLDSDVTVYDNVIDGILTDDTIITVNSGSVDLSVLKYAYFNLYSFSEDKTTLVLEQRVASHSHLGFLCYPWSIDGTDPNLNLGGGGSYEVTEQIDGCDVTKCVEDDLIVVGNKISGNLIRQLVDQSYDIDFETLATTYHNLNDYDMIQLYFPYETEEGSMYYFLCFLTDSYADGNQPTTPKPDDTAEETYEVTADKAFTEEEFAAILEENKTKDVEITVDGVTYTFKKGEMEAVDGAVYDFGATVTTDFSKLENPDDALNEENFVLHIDYNYSGKLPATASIRLYVGKEYAGKTLYYSQLLENNIKFVQSAVVDNDGYITVTQDHCSEYVLTTEDVTKTTPNTGIEGVAIFAGLAVIAAAGAVISKKRR